MFKKNKHSQSGFTLIEVLVVIGIMGILMALAIPSEITYRHKAELKTSAKDLRSMYWDAQGYSLAPRSDAPEPRDVTDYVIAVSSQTAPPAGPFKEQEIDVDFQTIDLKSAVMGPHVYIKDIKKYVGASVSSMDKLATYFRVGDNKTSGTMIFHNSVYTSLPEPSSIDADKIEIILATTLVPGFEYKIVLDKINNSINYIKN